MKKLVIVVFIGVGLYGLLEKSPNFTKSDTQQSTASEGRIESAFRNRQSNLQVSGSGVVIRVLPDDEDGSRHQKFILELPSGQTLLISHNIDLASRINSLRKADTVEFYGEYEWNAQGGIVHWTHHDPEGRHDSGWLKHQGAMYQ